MSDKARRKRERRVAQKMKGYKDVGVDSTRMARLSLEQLAYLYERAVASTVNTHGLPNEQERYWCHESTRAPNQDGYPNPIPLGVKPKGQWDNLDINPDRCFCLGQIVLAYNGFFAAHPLQEASHLCDNSMCVRVDHLAWEDRLNNIRRKGCGGQTTCDHCSHTVNVCKHEPRCIKLS